MILTFDIGNSQIKWAQWRSGHILRHGSFSSNRCSLFNFMAGYQTDGQPPEKVFSVCVGKQDCRDELIHLVALYWEIAVSFFHTSSAFSGRNTQLIHAYEDVSHHGADRWAGLIAASDEFDGPLCVIGAGTAITVDLLAADGRHLGGRILPAFYSMHSALLENAAAIDEKFHLEREVTGQQVGDVNLPAVFADTTEEAIASGIYYMLEAGVGELVEKVIKRLGPAVKIILTGGGAGLLLQFKNMPHFIYRPVLVMQGVYIALAKKPIHR